MGHPVFYNSHHLPHGMQTKAPVYNGRIMQKRVVVCIGKIGWGNKTTHKMYAIFIRSTKNAWGYNRETISKIACKTQPHAAKKLSIVSDLTVHQTF